MTAHSAICSRTPAPGESCKGRGGRNVISTALICYNQNIVAVPLPSPSPSSSPPVSSPLLFVPLITHTFHCDIPPHTCSAKWTSKKKKSSMRVILSERGKCCALTVLDSTLSTAPPPLGPPYHHLHHHHFCRPQFNFCCLATVCFRWGNNITTTTTTSLTLLRSSSFLVFHFISFLKLSLGDGDIFQNMNVFSFLTHKHTQTQTDTSQPPLLLLLEDQFQKPFRCFSIFCCFFCLFKN